MASATVNEGAQQLAKAAMVAGEVFVPGASQLIAGNVGNGVAHFVGTGLAIGLLAPTMPILALAAAIGLRANSYKLATQGSHLFSAISIRKEVPEKPEK